MKNVRLQPIPKCRRGSALLAALCLAIVFAICISSYVALCYTSLKMSTRNSMSMHCIELAETGMEQALYSQNNADWSLWTTSGTVATLKLPVTPIPSGAENGETWESKIMVTNYGTTSPTFQSWGVVTLPDGTTLTRELQAAGAIAPTFVNALAATTGHVSFQASGASLVDSYSSALGAYVAPGGYSAVVASGSTSTSGIVLNSGTVVQGYAVGTNASSFSYTGGSSIIGSGGPTGVDPSRTIMNPGPYQPQFTEKASANPTTHFDITGSAILGNSAFPTEYILSNITLAAGSTLFIQGPVILDVRNSVTMAGTILIDSVAVGGANVSLEIRLLNPATTMSITGTVTNTPLDPKRLAIIGTNPTATPTAPLILGCPQFCGVVYLPNAALSVTGNPTLFGSIVAQSITFAGTPQFHYDTSLQAPPTPATGNVAFSSFVASGASALQPVAVNSVLEAVPAATLPASLQ